MRALLAVEEEELLDGHLRGQLQELLSIVHVIHQLLHEVQELGLQHQSLLWLIVAEAFDVAVVEAAALEDLGVADAFLLDDAGELLEEGLGLGAGGGEERAGAWVAAVVPLLDEAGDLVELVEDAALVHPLLLQEDALHETDQFEDVAAERVDAGHLELPQDLLQAGQQRQLAFAVDVEQVEKVVLLFGDGDWLAALQHQAAVLRDDVLDLVR